jgi:hypothetical protein
MPAVPTIYKLSPDGSRLLYGTYLGGSSDEEYDTHSLAVDSKGNAYFSAVTSSRNCPVTPGAFRPEHAGGDMDVVIFKVGSKGDLLGCTYLGGRKNEDTEGLSVDGAGNVYVSGVTHSPNFPTTSGAYQSAYGESSGNAVRPLCSDSTAACRRVARGTQLYMRCGSLPRLTRSGWYRGLDGFSLYDNGPEKQLWRSAPLSLRRWCRRQHSGSVSPC